MKQLLITTVAALVLVGCGESGDKLSPRPLVERIKKTIPKDINIAETTLESQMVHHLKNNKKCIVVAQFGIYESVAILKLNPQPRVSNIKHIPITGTYYYIKHGKKIELEGYLNTEISGVVLKESYNDKATGNIYFSGNDVTTNYWRFPDSLENEKASIIHLLYYDKKMEGEEISRMYFENAFKIRDYSLPEISPLIDAKDRVWACKLPDNSLAFHINVTGDNFHLGRWKGIAIAGKTDNVFEHKSFPYGEKCEIKILLKPDESIVFYDNDCGQCCGARATLNGEYIYKNSILLLN